MRSSVRRLSGLAAIPACALFALAAPSAATTDAPSETFTATLSPLNDSGVSGTADLAYAHGRLWVRLDVSGVEAGKMHMQHIHGLAGNVDSTCPTADSADQIPGVPAEAPDPDQVIDISEGLDEYGPVLRPFTPYPMPETTTYTYTATFKGAELKDLQPLSQTLDHRAVVVHGMTLGGTYVGSLPVACGTIEPTG